MVLEKTIRHRYVLLFVVLLLVSVTISLSYAFPGQYILPVSGHTVGNENSFDDAGCVPSIYTIGFETASGDILETQEDVDRMNELTENTCEFQRYSQELLSDIDLGNSPRNSLGANQGESSGSDSGGGLLISVVPPILSTLVSPGLTGLNIYQMLFGDGGDSGNFGGESGPSGGGNGPENANARVELVVDEYSGVARTGEPVSTGIPLPEGAVTSLSNFKLVDIADKEIPSQYKVLSRWGDIDDTSKSIKWVLVTFYADVAKDSKNSYFLEYGGTINRGNYGANVVTPSGGKYIVNTGKIEFTVDDKEFKLFNGLKSDGKSFVSDSTGNYIAAFDSSMNQFSSNEVSAITVEENGPLKAVIKVEGGFRDSSGNYLGPRATSSRVIQSYPYVHFNVRYTVFKDKDYVLVTHIFENNGCKGTWPESKYCAEQRILLEGLNVQLDTIGFTNPQVISHTGTRSTNGEILIQTRGKFGWLRNGWVQNYNDPFPYLMDIDKKNVEKGTKHPGWVQITDAEKTLGVGIKYFYEKHPADIFFASNQLIVGVLPLGEGYPLDVDPNENYNGHKNTNTKYNIGGGVHYGTELLFKFSRGKGGSFTQEFEKLRNPLIALPDSQYIADTKAWPIAPGGLVVSDTNIQEAINRYDKRTLGMVDLNFAEDIPRRGPNTLSSFRGSNSRYFGNFNFGDIRWQKQYSTLHYDWTHAMFLHLLRHRNMEFWKMGQEMLPHRRDVDQYWGDRTDSRGEHVWINWLSSFDEDCHVNPNAKASGRGCPSEPRQSHNWVSGLILGYLLTGDEEAREAAEEKVKMAKIWYSDTSPMLGGNSMRKAGWTLYDMLGLHRAFGKKETYDLAMEIAKDGFVKGEQQRGGQGVWEGADTIPPSNNNWMSNTMYVYASGPIVQAYYDTKDPDIAALIVRMADHSMTKNLYGGDFDTSGNYRPLNSDYLYKTSSNRDGGGGIARGYYFVDIIAAAYDITKDQKYLTFARKLFRDVNFYFIGGNFYLDPKTRHPTSYAENKHTDTWSKVHGWFMRTQQHYLNIEYNLGGGVCQNGVKRNCPNQVGVCRGAQETCTAQNWPGCDATTYRNHNPAYATVENSATFCSDNLDNDCDGFTDCLDSDCTAICNARRPILTSISPDTVQQGVSTRITLRGQRFEDKAQHSAPVVNGVTWAKANFVTSTEIHFATGTGLPQGDIRIAVENEDRTRSDELILKVTGAGPQLNSISPNKIGNDITQDVVLRGSNFESTSQVLIDNIVYFPHLVKYISSSQINLTSQENSPPATYQVSVRNSNSQTSGQLPLNVTKPAVISNPRPQGTRPEQTKQVTMQVDTDIVANCKYDTNPNVDYNSMANSFQTTGARQHSTLITGLDFGNTYTYYIRCKHLQDSANSKDFTLTFSVANIVIKNTKFKGLTNLRFLNPRSIQDLILERVDTGGLVFPRTIAGTLKILRSVDLDNLIDVNRRAIYLNSSGLPEFNKPAWIYFYDSGVEQPEIRRDGVVCKEPVCRLVNIWTSNGRHFIQYRVQGFSNYTLNESCVDLDQDTYANNSASVCGGVSRLDCNDNNASIHPGAPEVCGNNVDDNCDGNIDENCQCSPSGINMTCGHSNTGICRLGNQTCQLNNTWGSCQGAILPQTEICGNNLDDDCDGQTDEGCSSVFCRDSDNDTYNITLPGGSNCGPLDCNDNNKNVNPGAKEICNNKIDDNCNGQIDEGCSSGGGKKGSGGGGGGGGGGSSFVCRTGENRSCGSSVGECTFGTQTCSNNKWGACTGGTQPTKEICDGKDNNCNAVIDDGNTCLECKPGETKSCGSPIGICTEGLQKCENGIWGDCQGNIPPKLTEICSNNLDDNCNGEIDESCEAPNHCSNFVQDENEEGIDCGGSCPACFIYIDHTITLFYALFVVIGALLLATYLYVKEQ